ncbi:MAG: IS110 family transposase [Pseudomonadota bacterium]
MNKTNTIGVDLAKNVFHRCIQDTKGHILEKTKLGRSQFKHFLATTPVSRVVFESCSTAHYWSRVANRYNHESLLIHPAYVKPYLKTNKNDFNDAEAICEADSRPTMRYVAAKTIAQQDIQLLHRIRQRQVQQRTALANQIRGQLLEYGVAIPQGISQVRSRLASILEDGENELTPLARTLFDALRQEFCEVDDRVKQADKQVKQLANEHPICQRLMKIPSIGPMIATALISAIGNASSFKNGRELSAWLGLVPKQYSTGGQQRLLGISKRGDGYVRALLVQGALSAITRCKDRSDDQLLWARGLQEKKDLQKAAVALANKTARIVWSVMAKDHDYVEVVKCST